MAPLWRFDDEGDSGDLGGDLDGSYDDDVDVVVEVESGWGASDLAYILLDLGFLASLGVCSGVYTYRMQINQSVISVVKAKCIPLMDQALTFRSN